MSDSRLGKSVLIVDHKLEELSRLRDILTALGFERAQAASSVNMAISFLRESRFDVVLVAYHLGKDEKNGLQLLQEVFAERLRTFQTVFLLLVDAESSSLLIGSLESAPDAYISRPYDRAKIQSRLEKLLRVKKVVSRVEEVMDQGDWDKAVRYCDKLAEVYPGLQVYLARLKGICLLESRQYEAATVLFEPLAKERKQVWAQVGLGMAHYFEGRFSHAVNILEQVVDQQHISVEAFVWLSRGLQAQGAYEQAVTAMRRAVLLQPTVPQLQSTLANFAAFQDDWALAAESFRASIKFARYSAFQQADDYFALVRCWIALYQSGKLAKEDLELQSVKLLEDAVHDFAEAEVIQFRVHLQLAELRRVLGNEALALSELNHAQQLFEAMEPEDQWRYLDWLEDAQDQPEGIEGVRRLKAVMIQQVGTTAAWVSAMLQGAQLYKQGQLDAAQTILQASSSSQCSLMQLNATQIACELHTKTQGADPQGWAQAVDRLCRFRFGALSEKQLKRFKALLQRSASQVQGK